MRLPSSGLLAVAFATAALACGATAPPASAIDPLKPVCGVAGLVSGVVGKACTAAKQGGRLIGAGKQLATGHVGGAFKALAGGGGSGASLAAHAVTLAAIGAWVLGGARFALRETATVLGQSTSPQLRSTWFSTTYWRMAAIAAVLTLPFLFAAAVQALIRSDLALLIRAAFGYLPLSMLAVGIAAPLTTLLLAAADEMSRIVASAAGDANGHFLFRAARAGTTAVLLTKAPFVAFVLGAFTVAAALVLWIELFMREAAVYVVVLMLPLAFAAFVWPARRIWALRAVEVLVALILSKFAIVAVLALGGAAMNASLDQHSIGAWLAGLVLLVLAAFTPWALLRLVPLAELAAGAAGSLRGEAMSSMRRPVNAASAAGHAGEAWAQTATGQMRRDAEATAPTRPAAEAVDSAPATESPRQPPPSPSNGTAPVAVAATEAGAGPDSKASPDPVHARSGATSTPSAAAHPVGATESAETAAFLTALAERLDVDSELRLGPPAPEQRPKRRRSGEPPVAVASAAEPAPAADDHTATPDAQEREGGPL